eukprot:Ihof_evm1s93 gene=Ihof_evmTU1s93
MGEVDVTVDQVYAALQVLHHDPDNDTKKQANKWLEQVQKSIYAWSLADQILQQDVSLEANYFAAQTMRTKIKYFFWELPRGTYSSLRDSLLQHMLKFASGPAPIIRQLSLAMADLLCYMSEWKGSVGDLLNMFGQTPESIPVLLEIMQELPEEVWDENLRLATSRIRALCSELDAYAAQVMELLIGSMEIPTLQEKSLKCFASWVRFGSFPDQLLVHSTLLSLPFDALRTSEPLAEASADAICAALYVCRDDNGYRETIQYILPRVMSFRQDYRQAVEAGNYDRAYSIARIFVELGESCIRIIMASSDGIAPVEAILDCARHNEYTICEMTFGFWHLLVKELMHLTNKKQEGPYAGPLRHIFGELVLAIMAKMRYPDLVDSDCVMERDDDFYHFRTSAGRLLGKVATLIGAGAVLKQIADVAQPLMLTAGGPETEEWRGLEASLFCMSYVACKVPPSETMIVPTLLQQVHTLVTANNTVVSVRQSGIVLMGSCSRWLAAHPTVICDVIQLACMALQRPLLASAAVGTICNLSENCQDVVKNKVDTLLDSMQAVDTYQLNKEDKGNLYKACGQIIASLPEVLVPDKLSSLVFPLVQSLSALMQQPANPPHGNTQACLNLDHISLVYKALIFKPRDVHSMHPCKSVSTQIWPLLLQSMTHYAADDLVMEKECRAIKAIITCLGCHSYELLAPLVTSILEVYQNYNHSPLLYLTSIVVKLVGEDESYQAGLRDMLQVLVQPIFTLLGTPAPDGADVFEQNPDLVEDFFRLLGAYVQYTPSMFFQTDVAAIALECAISGMHISMSEPLRAMSWYLRDVIHEGYKAQPVSSSVVQSVHSLIEQFGPEFMAALINCIGGAIPAHLLCEVSDILWDLVCLSNTNRNQLNGVTQDKMAQWLWAVLGKMPEDTLTQEIKNEFMVNIF